MANYKVIGGDNAAEDKGIDTLAGKVVVDGDTFSCTPEGFNQKRLLRVALELGVIEKVGSGKRARNEKGHLKADDPSTPDVNEAYEDGKTPAKKKKAGRPKKKK
jgi:hypothetical protein